jgi:hypothetical protein
LIQKASPGGLASAIAPQMKITLITDAGFHNKWFRHIKARGWGFIGRIQGNVKFCLHHDAEHWLNVKNCAVTAQVEYLGSGTLARS